ncbi:helix-turn-helix domain-containing protein [Actinokineospora sp. NBRC 105648]|uniref:helix-turn-helix domain-containing protein n=1 Tax=Actinokineospora sp. NBRC 105648 TaxID=3032206 RepID=UPI0024A1602A|nr:helix-turn-helix domain-containing protein [Actinokineospora sp. NBRC 105648]GLZ37726.1 transcriptional regulator [Actinokineospora sp. NBRC 105648]
MTDPAPITDPKALRALAHPVRWQLLELLLFTETATATQCAAAIGESVASCSYHLNMLAKYGYVEPVDVPGREKPWRRKVKRTTLNPEELEGESQLAAEAATEAFISNESARLVEQVRQQRHEPPEWQQATGITVLLSYLTATESADLAAEIRALFERYRDRAYDAAKRPSGSRPVRFTLSNYVVPGTTEIP